MGEIKTLADQALRYFNVDGDPDTGKKKVDKVEMRGVFDLIDFKISGLSTAQGGGFYAFETTALMNADTAAPLNSVAWNLEDDNDYRKTAMPSTWTLIGPSEVSRLLTVEATAADHEARIVAVEAWDAGNRLDTVEGVVSAQGVRLDNHDADIAGVQSDLASQAITIGGQATLIATLDTRIDVYDSFNVDFRLNDLENADIALGDRITAVAYAQETIERVRRRGDQVTRTLQNLRLVSTLNQGVSPADGTVVTHTGHYLTPFIEVEATDKLVRFGPAVTAGVSAPIVYYNKDREYISSAWTANSNLVEEWDMSLAPAGTKYVRCTLPTASSELYFHEPKSMAYLRDALFALLGAPEDASGTLNNRWIDKSTGAFTGNSSYRTALLEVGPSSWVTVGGGLISPTESIRAQMTFWNEEEVSISIASPAVVSWDNHPFAENDRVVLTTTGLLPTGLTVGTAYYAVNVVSGVGGSFQLSTTPSTTPGWTGPINTSDTQSGTASAGKLLGFYNSPARWMPVKIGDVAPAATNKVRVTQRLADMTAIYVVNATGSLYRDTKLLASALVANYFEDSFIAPGRLTFAGGITQPTHEYWRTTGYIPVYPGQELRYTGQLMTANSPTMMGFDADKGSPVVLDFVALTNTNLNDHVIKVPTDGSVAFVRSTFRNDVTPYSLYGARVPASTGGGTSAGDISYFAPEEAYGRVGEPVYLYGEGIVGDPAITVTFSGEPNRFASMGPNSPFAEIVSKASEGENSINVKVRAIVGTATTLLSTFPVHFTDVSTVESPTAWENVIIIGDSTTSQVVSGDPNALDGDGTSTNEFSRQLTGTGDPAISTAPGMGDEWGPVVTDDIRDPLALTNIVVRGTRGDGAVGHEGRGGWHISSYLERDDELTMHRSAPFVAGNVINGVLDLRGVTHAITAVPFNTDSDTTWADLVAEIQTKMLLYGTGPTATVSDSDDAIIRPRFSISFNNFVVTGGASQPDITFLPDGKINAFWNPDPLFLPWGPAGTTWKFSMEYYLRNNGFRLADTADGVNATGSNLTVMIALGWNDYGNNTDPGVSASNLQYMINHIKSQYADVTIWVLGLWAPPRPPQYLLQSSMTTVEKWYSTPEIFDFAIRRYGEAYRNVCKDITNCHFVQLSHQLDPTSCYTKGTAMRGRTGHDNSLKVEGVGSFVHMARRGYYQEACVLVDKFLKDKCVHP